MITQDGWFDFAIRMPGPAWKQNGGRNGGKGMVPHSLEGFEGNVMNELNKPNRRSSWGGTTLKDGRFWQHYPVWAQTWTSGSSYPNNNFFAFENEGLAGQPLTQPQVDLIIRIGRELIDLQGWAPRRPTNANDKSATLYEHNECVRFGSEPTACPSGRIPWSVIVPALTEELEDDMTERVWCAERFQTWLVGKGGAYPVTNAEDDKRWTAIYGPHTKVMTGAELDKLKVK